MVMPASGGVWVTVIAKAQNFQININVCHYNIIMTVIIIMLETSSGMHSSQASTILGMAGTNGRFYYQVRSIKQ